MELKFIKLTFLGFIFLVSTCSKEDIDSELSQCSLENEIKILSDITGVIMFDTQSEAYAIFRGIEGTFDGQDIGVVCNLPDKFKKEGEKVIFSGTYYENKNFVPQISGQEYYYLELNKIDVVINN